MSEYLYNQLEIIDRCDAKPRDLRRIIDQNNRLIDYIQNMQGGSQKIDKLRKKLEESKTQHKAQTEELEKLKTELSTPDAIELVKTTFDAVKTIQKYTRDIERLELSKQYRELLELLKL